MVPPSASNIMENTILSLHLQCSGVSPSASNTMENTIISLYLQCSGGIHGTFSASNTIVPALVRRLVLDSCPKSSSSTRCGRAPARAPATNGGPCHFPESWARKFLVGISSAHLGLSSSARKTQEYLYIQVFMVPPVPQIRWKT